MMTTKDVDYAIVGGGFYGCCLALYLRSISKNVTVLEAGHTLMNRASRVNQARLHSGFHYPRSMVTALKSARLCHRFADDFPDAVRSDFQMLYAIARIRSKISANRFLKMFQNMDAPISEASAIEHALFDESRIEAVFRANEYAFDYTVLARHLGTRMDAVDIDLRLNTEVMRIDDHSDMDRLIVHLSDGSALRAKHVFNVTYAQINHVLRQSGLPMARLKHEITEIVLTEPPEELHGYAVTVMDGPFFSMMPYPAKNKYSLTHVRYTPQTSWTDQSHTPSPYEVFETAQKQTRFRHMTLDAARYLPCIGKLQESESIYDVKTVLVKNEGDDGRPILVHKSPGFGRVTSVLGGKIDNIYDLFSYLRAEYPEMANANASFMLKDQTVDDLGAA